MGLEMWEQLHSWAPHHSIHIYPNEACIMENIEKSYTGRNIHILPDTQGAMKALDSFQIIPNYSRTAISPW